MNMTLQLYHGRDDSGQVMDDWGFEAEPIEGVTSFIVTYMTDYTIAFENREAYLKAKKITGWDSWDENQLRMSFRDDMIEADGKFYGDWSLSTPRENSI